MHVPAATKATTPLVELMEQTKGVELEKLFVPVPAEAVAVIVGGVALNKYEELYEPESIVRVLGLTGARARMGRTNIPASDH